MTLDPADLVTEIDTAIDAVPGAATPSRSSLAQDIVEALWAAVIDHFVDRPFAGSDPGLVPSSDGSTSKFLRGDGTFAAPSGGDGWTYVVLTSEFSTTSTTRVAITGLGFTPDADSYYEIEAKIVLSTATGGGPEPGVMWPTGLASYGGAIVSVTNTTTSIVEGGNTQGTDFTRSNGSVPANNNGYLGTVEAIMVTGASPSGDFSVSLESSLGGTVYCRVGSLLKYRKIAV